MEENGSSMNFMTEVREVYGRTLAFSEVEGSMTQLKQSLHNGFEIWWLAGMPVLIVFACMLLSLVLVSSTINSTNNTRKWNLQVTSLFSNNKRRKYNKHHATSVNPSTNSATTPVLPTNLKIPKHIAVIMDGNRRYGKAKYGSGTRGHTDGSRTLVNFTQWCMEMGIQELTVFAFSTGNLSDYHNQIANVLDIYRLMM
jgi:hypothetical protein